MSSCHLTGINHCYLLAGLNPTIFIHILVASFLKKYSSLIQIPPNCCSLSPYLYLISLKRPLKALISFFIFYSLSNLHQSGLYPYWNCSFKFNWIDLLPKSIPHIFVNAATIRKKSPNLNGLQQKYLSTFMFKNIIRVHHGLWVSCVSTPCTDPFQDQDWSSSQYPIASVLMAGDKVQSAKFSHIH